ncbi:MAG: alpha/beta hydrolase [Sedimentisphaerales bacterium]|nr:alpha/beta hydrolase [Sedimentisphaerales bacterium]
MKRSLCILIILTIYLVTGCQKELLKANKIVHSFDNVPIYYSINGSGSTALVFVHGWSCDGRYWNEQVEHFSKNYQVVTVDLAGHGLSGRTRNEYTFEAYARDVQAVMADLNCRKIILIGHSMAGLVILKAGQLDDRIVALVAVDTLNDVTIQITQENKQQYLGMFTDDFAAGVNDFVGPMFHANDDPAIKQKVIDKMAKADPDIAINTLEHYFKAYVEGDVERSARDMKKPIYFINADLWPTNEQANASVFSNYKKCTIIPDSGHFIMLTESSEFNKNLDNIAEIYK